MKTNDCEKQQDWIYRNWLHGPADRAAAARSGFNVIAYDHESSNAERLVPYGGAVVKSVAELATSCNVVLSCLPDDAVMNLHGGASGVLASAARGSLVVDMSTVYLQKAKETVAAWFGPWDRRS